VSACDLCLRRSALLGLLAPYIENELKGSRRLPALLSLDDEALVHGVCGQRKRQGVDTARSRFDAATARREAEASQLDSVCQHQSDYPHGLLEADDAPAMLYLRGDRAHLKRLLSDPMVAIVGSRKASDYGCEVACSLARELSACGVTVVSGMALGVDSGAHEGALDGGGLTVAVLGSGADNPYPRSKSTLYERIVKDGLVLSEMPPGFTPFRWCFPARNRIMAALATMTVVVEGTERSGSLITARFAADLGREVGAVPGQVTSALAKGPNALLADGACVVRSAADVLDAIYGPSSAEARGRLEMAEPELTESLRELLATVERGKGSADSIASHPRDVPEILAGLTELELLGLVRRTADGSYVRCL
jgi:DNA processing protein